jgi:hypothetical protein
MKALKERLLDATETEVYSRWMENTKNTLLKQLDEQRDEQASLIYALSELVDLLTEAITKSDLIYGVLFNLTEKSTPEEMYDKRYNMIWDNIDLQLWDENSMLEIAEDTIIRIAEHIADISTMLDFTPTHQKGEVNAIIDLEFDMG